MNRAERIEAKLARFPVPLSEPVQESFGPGIPIKTTFRQSDVVRSGEWSPDNVRFRDAILSKHGAFSSVLNSAFWQTVKTADYVAANIRLRRADARLKRGDLRLSMSESELRSWCASRALMCQRIVQAVGAERAAPKLESLLAEYGLAMPVSRDLFGEAAAVERCKCEMWWRRSIRRLLMRECEEVARDLRLVNDRKAKYVHDYTVKTRRQRQVRNRALLTELQAVNQYGDSYTLQELADLSVSNPEIRRCELMVRIAGFEEVAKSMGLVAEFYTVTCPSKFHPIKAGGIPNEKFNGATAREANGYLCRLWARARAAIGRAGVHVFGFRVAEPHHDGCPHWHYLLFLPSSDVSVVRGILRKYALQEDGHELGAQKHRFKYESIDTSKGSATGYIAKYISKGINGYGLAGEGDLFASEEIEGAERVSAWASCHGVRQFQQIGGPSVTVWRELRRLALEDVEDDVEELWQAADSSDWAAFVVLMGGPFCGRSQTLKVAFWQEFNVVTGECIDPVVNRYGEVSKGRVIGLWSVGRVVVTRFYKWVISRVSHGLERLTDRLGGGFWGAHAPPWTCVNNCTGGG